MARAHCEAGRPALRAIDGRILTGVLSVRNDLFPSFPDMARTVGILIFPEFQLLTAVGPITVFDAAARNSTSPPYRLRVIAPAAGPVTSSSGLVLPTDAQFLVRSDTDNINDKGNAAAAGAVMRAGGFHSVARRHYGSC